MARRAKELGALAVKNLTTRGRHYVGGDGAIGLALQVAPGGSRSWILRTTVNKSRRDIGLGGYPDVPLGEAREAAKALRAKIRAGIDPVAERIAARSALLAQASSSITFEAASLKYIAAQELAWKNAKHRQQWTNTLETYAYPVIGKMLVSDIKMAHILKILEPIWATRNETASRLRGRIERVLSWSHGRGYCQGDNPARWQGNLKEQLPAPNKVARVKHHQALPFVEVGNFTDRLREADGVGARALEFLILTAARSGEVRGATWDEIDLEKAEWNIPAERMKAGEAHRVPLSGAALELLKALPRMVDTSLCFPASRGGQLSDMTLTAVLRRMNVKAVPHGFRSTFRDWVAEETDYHNHVAEMALAHKIGNKVEAAYRRGSLFEKRVHMMADWANYCATPRAGNVISILALAS